MNATLNMSRPADERLKVRCTEVGLRDGEIEGMIVIPVSVKEIGDYAFFTEKNPGYTINYAGTIEQWEKIKLGKAWRNTTVKIKCSDGTIRD